MLAIRGYRILEIGIRIIFRMFVLNFVIDFSVKMFVFLNNFKEPWQLKQKLQEKQELRYSQH